MMEALKWIEEDQNLDMKYAIYTDSLSLIMALKANDWGNPHEWLRCIKVQLNSTQKDITICWVPSHCNTFGNDREDDLADRGSKMDKTNAPVTLRINKA